MGRASAVAHDLVGLAHLSIINKCGWWRRGGGFQTGGEEAAVAEDSGGPGQGGRGAHNLVSVWVVGGVRRLEGSQKRKARQKPTGGRRSMRRRAQGT
jgi:hypothetical protein